jgi:hypothetical protein
VLGHFADEAPRDRRASERSPQEAGGNLTPSAEHAQIVGEHAAAAQDRVDEGVVAVQDDHEVVDATCGLAVRVAQRLVEEIADEEH